MPSGLCGEEEKQGSSVYSARNRPAPSQHSALAIVTAASRNFSPREHISLSKHTSLHPPVFPLGKASPRHRVQSGILPRESGGNSCTVITWCERSRL